MEDEEWIQLVCDQVKDDISEFLQSLSSKTDEKLQSLENHISVISMNLQDDLKDSKVRISSVEESFIQRIEQLEFAVSSLTQKSESFQREVNSQLLGLQNSISSQSSDLGTLQDELSFKASIDSVDDLRSVVRKCASKRDFDELNEKVKLCALEKEQERLKRKVLVCVEELENRVTEDALKTELNEVDRKQKNYVDSNFCTLSILNSFKHKAKENSDNIKIALDRVNESLNHKESSLKNAVSSLTRDFNSKPWESTLLDIKKDLDEKAEKADFYEIQHSVDKKIETFANKHNSVNEQIENINSILERFDEIFLEKASKDDFKQLTSQMASYFSKVDFSEHLSEYKNTISTVQNDIKTFESISHNLKLSMNNLIQRFEGLRRENYEVSIIHKTIESFREEMSHKADKIDIFQIYDLMGRRDELVMLKEDFEGTKKQLEITAMIVKELSRTLLNAGETPSVLFKQRTELHKHAENLLNWLCRETTPFDRSRRLKTARTGSNPIKMLFTPRKRL